MIIITETQKRENYSFINAINLLFFIKNVNIIFFYLTFLITIFLIL